jgi:hypothetical protein
MEKAILNQWNRQLSPDAVNDIVDEGGVHLVSSVMVHEHRAGRACEPHLRCRLLIKAAGSLEPVEAWLDVDIESFAALETVLDSERTLL